jgi:peptidoglycan/xylan/chitin deacetylase (PgdA/CDA1 family)
LSIDFEMRWGRHDRLAVNDAPSRAEFEQGLAIIPEILKTFSDRQLRATWAVVGAIGCTGWQEYFQIAPPPPQYRDANLAIKRSYADMDPDGKLHFSTESLARITETSGQDLGTHTFSHIFLREPGVTRNDFVADLKAAVDLARKKLGKRPVSFVFPRNQSNFLDVLSEAGIRMWRGNPRAWYYQRYEAWNNKPVAKALRYLDGLIPLSRIAAPVCENMCRASAFVRFDLPDGLWRLHVQRLMREVTVMKPGESVHLWFHEHNLGRDTTKRMRRLVELCDRIAETCQSKWTVSENMVDLGARYGMPL